MLAAKAHEHTQKRKKKKKFRTEIGEYKDYNNKDAQVNNNR